MSAHPHDHQSGHGGPADPPGGHGMVVLGTQTVFLSHLPMFHGIHAYQVILEVMLVRKDGLPQQDYVADRQSHPDQRLYTLDPRPFVLPDILPDGANPPRLSSFRGDVVRGHFERPETSPVRIARDVVVSVLDVVHGHKFAPGTGALGQLEYILFGKGNEVFLAHLITRPPDFDQLIQVEIDHELSDEELRGGHHVTVPDRANTARERIQPGDGKVSATLHMGGSEIPVTISPGVEFYLEEGELRV